MSISTEVLDVQDSIYSLIASGDPEAAVDAPFDVLIECARRYLIAEMRARDRASVRAKERRARVNVSDVDASLLARMQDAARDYSDRAVRWTVELLDASFALPDGTRVSWADATTQQHAERAASLENQAASVVETAALHREAIAAIRGAGVTTLREVVS